MTQDAPTPQAERPAPPVAYELPQPVARPTRWHIPLIWIIPLIAALTGGWLAWRELQEHGPSITISFPTAEGLEAGSTHIKYRSVDIGTVTRVKLASDRQNVIVTAQLVRGADEWLKSDTRFWVVRPRVGAGGISGLGTLLSGVYIGMDVGKAEEEASEFKGLDTPPAITSDQPGRSFDLLASDLGSLDVGTPVYFRRLAVGQVESLALEPSGRAARVQVFVHSPYDRFVNNNTRFWHASGLNVSLDANGLSFNTPSLVSAVTGGIEFGSPFGHENAPPAAANTRFSLAADQRKAMEEAFAAQHAFTLIFRESVRGLSIGAPVEFRGIKIGEVTGFHMEYDSRKQDLQIPVSVSLNGNTLRVDDNKPDWLGDRALLDSLVQRGLRAQLRTGSLVTGQLYVELDLLKTAAKGSIDWSSNPPRLPTQPGSIQAITETAERIVKRIDDLPVEALVADLRNSIKSFDSTLKKSEQLVSRMDSELTPAARQTLEQARDTLSRAEQVLGSESPLQADARTALQEMSRAARALRTLMDYLERHPEGFIRGKKLEP